MNPMFEIGHYVPQLAQLIIQSNLKINLKGIAVSRTWNIISEINLGKKNFLCQIILTNQNCINLYYFAGGECSSGFHH